MYNSLFNSKIVLISKLIKIDLVLIKVHYSRCNFFLFFKLKFSSLETRYLYTLRNIRIIKFYFRSYHSILITIHCFYWKFYWKCYLLKNFIEILTLMIRRLFHSSFLLLPLFFFNFTIRVVSRRKWFHRYLYLYAYIASFERKKRKKKSRKNVNYNYIEKLSFSIF